MIASGRVRVDGQTVTTPGTLVDPDTQTIEVDGQSLETAVELFYVALNKPIGYVSTVSDRHAPRKVTDLVSIPGARLVPAGRLDADSEGLLLLSNDGDFIYKVTHPSQSLGKTYHVTVDGSPAEHALERVSRGFALPGETRKTAPATCRVLGKGDERGTTILEITIHEGRNRQIRRMFDILGYPVVRLMRVKVGPIMLHGLPLGEWRPLTPREIRTVLNGYDEPQARTVPPKPGKLITKGHNTMRPAPRPPTDSRSNGSARYNTPKPRIANTRQDNNRPYVRQEHGGPASKHDSEELRKNEVGHRGSSRPGQRQDNGKPAAGRVQVHEDRFHGRVPARGQHHAADRNRGQGRRPGSGDYRRSE